jgi:hypothetical protein
MAAGWQSAQPVFGSRPLLVSGSNGTRRSPYPHTDMLAKLA